MATAAREIANERIRFITLALLFFAHAVVGASNEVVATSGFISNLGASQILWVWAADSLIIILASSAYSLIVDRTNRRKLAIGLFAGFSAGYAAVFGLFVFGAPDGLTYTTLKLMNSQQDNLLPLVVGALAADIFTLSESKRLFGLLGGAAIVGELAGNGLAIGVARLFGGNNTGLLLGNAAWLLAGALVLAVAVRRIEPATRQAREGERLLDVLRGGMLFVRDVAVFRYLAISTLLLGIGWTVIQYQFLVDLSEAYPETGDLQVSYGIFKIAIPVLLLFVQTVGLRWLMRWWGFKTIFTLMPGVLLFGLTLMLIWPGLITVVIGCYLAQVTSQGINEPSEQSFLGLVPDELRGRMGAFLHGFLYQFGYLLGYILVGVVLLLVSSPQTSRLIYVSMAWAGLVVAVWAALRIRATYDSGLLNWRWQRRRRQVGVDLKL
jgi:AAA family ATP:ADP antiporter